VHCNAPGTTLRKGCSPTGFLGRQLENAEMTRMVGEKLSAQFDRVAMAGVGDLVEERLSREGRVSMTDRPPPEDGNPDVGGVQIDREVRDRVWQALGALD
jgi:hypothetical protein